MKQVFFSLNLKFHFFSSSALPYLYWRKDTPLICKNIDYTQIQIDELMKKNESINIIEKSIDQVNKLVEGLTNKKNIEYNLVKNYRLDSNVKKLRIEIKKIRHRLRDYLNYFNVYLYDENGCKNDISIDPLIANIDFERLFKQIGNFYNLKRNVLSSINNFFIIDYLFLETEETILRLLNAVVIMEKKFVKPFPILTDENKIKVIEICKNVIINPLDSESKKLYAQRVLINLFSLEDDYFYDDYLVELNLSEYQKVKNDYDIVFLHGLNVISF